MATTFPETPYQAIMSNVSAKWDSREAELTNLSVKYWPSVSTGWDSSPRTLIHDPYEEVGYPWGPSFHAEPQEFGQALHIAKVWAQKRCRSGGGAAGCPPILINAWNEWSEGACKLPDRPHPRFPPSQCRQEHLTFLAPSSHCGNCCRS